MKYRIPLVADARVGTVVEVKADSLEEAQKKAIQSAKEGNEVWTYEGVDDSTIELGE